jgi:hypothetical protein
MLIFSVGLYVITALVGDALYVTGAMPIAALVIVLHVVLLGVYALNIFMLYHAAKLRH